MIPARFLNEVSCDRADRVLENGRRPWLASGRKKHSSLSCVKIQLLSGARIEFRGYMWEGEMASLSKGKEGRWLDAEDIGKSQSNWKTWKLI